MPSRRDLRAQRRAEIVDAARALVAESGVEALTIGRLEQKVAFTRGVVTYHFENKDDIVAAVLESALGEIDRATIESFDPTAPLDDQVGAVLGAKIRGFLGHPEATRILLAFWARPPDDPRTREVNQRLFRTYRKQAAQWVRGHGADADADAVAALLVGTVIGVVTQVQLDPERVDPEAVLRVAARALADHLRRR